MRNTSACTGALLGLLLVILLAAPVSVTCADDVRGATAQNASPGRVQSAPTTPARTKRLALPSGQPRYKCEDGECVCKGVLDCKSLIDSGFCKDKQFWQDGKDPSVGGCG